MIEIALIAGGLVLFLSMYFLIVSVALHKANKGHREYAKWRRQNIPIF